MGSCAAPSAKGDDKFITTDYLQQCPNKLPDLRGEFIRGWDDGRGIDAGRALLSIQAGMLEKHRHIVVANDGYDSNEEWELATIFRRAYTQGRGLDAADAGGTLIPSPTLHT
ncbi:hypothetical protein OFB78_29265, partial [Escherichia coli]|nr:hypothetical protein [Escherichia coli]MCV5111401.1 hypothetical protein [Escherichia coli]